MRTKKKSAALLYLEKLNGGPATFAQLLNSFRLCDEMSQTAYARKLGISRAHLCDLEKGRRFVGVERAAAFARAVGWPPEFFVKVALRDELARAGLDFEIEVYAA